MKPISKVLLFTGNPETAENYRNCFEQTDDFNLIDVSDNLIEAQDTIGRFDVQILIMDLEKRQQLDTVIQMLDDFFTVLSSFKPFILVISDLHDRKTFDKIHDAGADFIISKSKPDYSVQLAVDFLRLVFKAPQTPCRSHHDYYPRMLKIIFEELDAAGINQSHIGYCYLAEAILLFLEGRHMGYCSTIGRRYEKNVTSVTRAMQNAIDYAWRRVLIDPTSYDKWYMYSHPMPRIPTHSKRGIPTVSEFIHYYVRKINDM